MTQNQLTTGIAVVVALAVVALFFVFSNPFGAVQQAPGTLVVQDTVVGSGDEARAGVVVEVNYTGKFDNGTVFDTSVGKSPIVFRLGEGNVIPGWEQGLLGMKEGGRRVLIIPPDLAYGATGYGPIPPNATLHFEVELLKVTPSENIDQLEGPSSE